MKHLLFALLFAASVRGAVPDESLFSPPAEERWSIATGWKDGWPRNWHHAKPTRTEQVGEWTAYFGTIRLPEGDWQVRDLVRLKSEGLLECRRRWEWKGQTSLEPVTLTVRWSVKGKNARPFLPGISYYDNPAGQTVDATRIPVIGKQPGNRGYYEEHRFPMPLAGVEALGTGGLFGAFLHSVPSPLQQGNRADQWWSLGLEYQQDRVELGLISGATASNGKDGIIKANQKSFLDYPDGWLKIEPGAIIDKRFFIQLYPVSQRGHGFRPAVWESARLADAYDFHGFPALKEIVALKFADSQSRWREDEQCAGVDAFPDTRGRVRNWIDLGWAGQSEALAYPLLLLGEKMGIERRREMAQKSVDFITTSPFDRNGFSIRYDIEKHRWIPRRNPLSQGQAINNLLNALRIARNDPRMNVAKWESFLRKACEFHGRRVLADDWNPRSTNEGFLIAPLAQASVLLNEPRFMKAARKAADHYGRRHVSMDEPYWGGTLDARCEDKEGAWAALQGFLAMYEATKEQKYLDWAGHAADVVVSYVYVWDVPLPAGRLADNHFKSRGWTSVSVQNMHLDVYGVLCAPAIWQIGKYTGRREYQDMARLMVVACGQLVDPWGSQGEQMHQTNYAQHYQVSDLQGVRGDYVESWNVYWISAHFLNAAAMFEEMGVPWDTW